MARFLDKKSEGQAPVGVQMDAKTKLLGARNSNVQSATNMGPIRHGIRAAAVEKEFDIREIVRVSPKVRAYLKENPE
jgi:hypothetical protein